MPPFASTLLQLQGGVCEPTGDWRSTDAWRWACRCCGPIGSRGLRRLCWSWQSWQSRRMWWVVLRAGAGGQGLQGADPIQSLVKGEVYRSTTSRSPMCSQDRYSSPMQLGSIEDHEGSPFSPANVACSRCFSPWSSWWRMGGGGIRARLQNPVRKRRGRGTATKKSLLCFEVGFGDERGAHGSTRGTWRRHAGPCRAPRANCDAIGSTGGSILH